jgi:ligand-binding SRPBCC domain-containing protein
MADHLLERRVWLPRPRAEVFALWSRAAHRPIVQPGWGFRWRAAPPERLAPGALLDFRVRMVGLSARWRLMVRELDEPHRVVEVALWGPFARWEHRCRLAAGAEAPGGPGGTWVVDVLAYRLAAGPLGELWLAAGGARALDRAFGARDRRLLAWSGAGATRPDRAAPSVSGPG